MYASVTKYLDKTPLRESRLKCEDITEIDVNNLV
jgi:hypothetical protein